MTQKERAIICAIQILELPHAEWGVIETTNRNGDYTTSISIKEKWGSDVVEFSGWSPDYKGTYCWFWDAEEKEVQQ